MTCDASDEQGPSDGLELLHVADHELDVYRAGYACLRQVLLGGQHDQDHIQDFKEVAVQIHSDLLDQLDRGSRESHDSPLPRGGTSDAPSVPTSPIYGDSSAVNALRCYGNSLAIIRQLVTQVRAGELDETSAFALIRGQLEANARDLGEISDYSLRLNRHYANMRSTGQL